jgi:glycosyltransferase involved in cell wall biosynthesis
MLASVIIPTRNRPRAIIACLDAIGRQEFTAHAYEIIVVDDGSDDCLQLDPRRWADRFELRVLRQENAGPAAARQRGVADARGAILAFTDDDCLPAPGWLATLVAALDSFPESMVGGSTFNGLSADMCAETSQLILEIVYEHFNSEPSGAYFFASNNIAMRRSDYLANGGFDGGSVLRRRRTGSSATDGGCRGDRCDGFPPRRWNTVTPRRFGYSPACTTGTVAARFSMRTVVVTATQARWSRTWAFTAPFPGVCTPG